MSAPVSILRVRELPPEIGALAQQASSEGFGMVDRLVEEWGNAQNRFELPGEAFFIARVATELVGVVGLNRDPYSDLAGIGRLRRLYVLPGYRRRGVGRKLTMAVVEVARVNFARLRLRTHDPGAAAFYEALDFVRLEAEDASHCRLL